jgi:hypothetical protein
MEDTTMHTGLIIPADRKLREANKRANEQADKLAKQPKRAEQRHVPQQRGKRPGSRSTYLAAIDRSDLFFRVHVPLEPRSTYAARTDMGR